MHGPCCLLPNTVQQNLESLDSKPKLILSHAACACELFVFFIGQIRCVSPAQQNPTSRISAGDAPWGKTGGTTLDLKQPGIPLRVILDGASATLQTVGTLAYHALLRCSKSQAVQPITIFKDARTGLYARTAAILALSLSKK